MWVNVFLILITALAIAGYKYLTRNFGWFKARGVHEHDPCLPFGCSELNSAMVGGVAFTRMLKSMYFK